MMSISALGAAGGDKAWYAQSQASDESRMEGYYQGGDREPPGVWQGRGLEALGLELGDKVSDAVFKNIIEGRTADGSDLGVQGAGENHRAGWDLTFSAPKSVSLAWAAADGEMHSKISSAHNAATAKALAFIEDQAAYGRRGKAGAEHEKLPGLAFATYQHCDSREGDPQLHSHCLVMNLAHRADGTFGGIESKHIYDWHHAAGAIYRAELAKEMEALGFQVKKDRDYFKIAGISEDITKHFSKRRIQIETALAKAGIAAGKAKSSELASLSTRGKKLVEMTREVFLKTWKTLLGEKGLDAEKVNEISSENYIDQQQEATAIDSGELDFIDSADDGEEAQDIFSKLTAHDSIFKEQDIYKLAAIESQLDGSGADGARAKVQDALAVGQIVHLKSGMMTTREMLKIESSMVRQAQNLRDRADHGIDNKTIDSALAEFTKEKGFSLSAEQEAAVRAITSAGDLKMVRGAAGSGKSTMAEAAKIAWQKQGYSVIGAALSGKAAAGLQDGSGIESRTIHRTLFEIEKGNLNINNKTVIVIDEAGMIGSRQMQKLTQIAEATGAKLVLIGDERQLQAVDAGGAFRALQNQLPEFAQLNEVRRQRNDLDKQAANDIATGKGAEALKNYIARDLVHVAETVDATRQAVVDAWSKDNRSAQDKIILAGTRKDVYELNQAARATMELGTNHKVQTATGEREFAAGDRVVITKNNSDLDIMNGNFGTVQSIKFNHSGELEMSIKIDGRDDLVKTQITGKDAFTNIDHGYAATVHKSQGATVDSAYFYAGSMTDKELGYVAMSRHRDVCQVFTARSKLEEQLDKSQAQATEKMQALAQSIAIKKDLNIDNIDIQDFRDVRDFLNTHADQVILTDNDGWGSSQETKQTLIALGSALEQSNLKETTLDHVSIEQAEEIIQATESNQSQESEQDHEVEI